MEPNELLQQAEIAEQTAKMLIEESRELVRKALEHRQRARHAGMAPLMWFYDPDKEAQTR